MVVAAVRSVPSRQERPAMKQTSVIPTKASTATTRKTSLGTTCSSCISNCCLPFADLIAVGCELNGVYYLNGQTFQPNPLYKCLCVNGAIGCTPVFTPKLAASPCTRVTDRKKPGQLICGLRQHKQLQSTNYRLMSGVPDYTGKLSCTGVLLPLVSLAPAASLAVYWQFLSSC
ncbi:hypothetical protein Q9233_004033 [Columba guinea]|nr:hypothetical protein Q9233_004033 [Columba guinea]